MAAPTWQASAPSHSATDLNAYGAGSPNGDTWTWNGTTWTQQTLATSPSARHTAMAYDAASPVLFGGYFSMGQALSPCVRGEGL